jgi:hypothetical protein
MSTDVDFLKYKLLKDTLFFTRYFFKKTYARKFVVGNHHKLICDKLENVYLGKCKRLIINIAPRYTKTELVVKSFISKGLALNPKSRFIHTSYSESLALDNSEYIRNLIKADYFQELFPIKTRKDSDSKSKWYTEEGGGVYATSSGGQITGFGAGNVEDEEKNMDEFIMQLELMKEFAGAIVIDDPIKPEDARSKVKRDAINQRFDTTIRSRTNSRNTPIIVVMQRVHEDDLTGYLLKTEPGEWEILSLPALKDGKALWHFKHTVQELQHLQKINYYVFQTQYQQETKGVRTGGEFLKSFDISKHVNGVMYNPDTTIGIAVDNNVYPYIAISIWQIEGRTQRQIHEIPAKDPNNTASKAGRLVVEYLDSLNYNDIVFIYGDQTTENRNTIDDDKKSFLDKFIEEIRKKYVIRKRIQTKNPPVAITGEFVDSILNAEYDGLKIEISESCTESIKDYNETKEDSEGKILKKRTTDSQTGISYEENGHYTDLLRYKVFVDFKESFLKFAKGDLQKDNYTLGQPVTDRSF